MPSRPWPPSSTTSCPPSAPEAGHAPDVERSSDAPVSRSLIGKRPAVLSGLVDQGNAIEEAPVRSAPAITGHRFVTAPLNVWSGPSEDSVLLTELPVGTQVGISGVVQGEWAQIVRHHKARWVHAAYLSTSDPGAVSTAGITLAPCRLGTAVEAGLTPDAIRVYRSVCAAFPEVTSYGGVRADGEHSEGRALDIMVSSSALGDAIAAWVRANASELGASEVLWAQHIWTVERSSEGWRLFEDRGSITANHYDHVHVTVYGTSGG